MQEFEREPIPASKVEAWNQRLLATDASLYQYPSWNEPYRRVRWKGQVTQEVTSACGLSSQSDRENKGGLYPPRRHMRKPVDHGSVARVSSHGSRSAGPMLRRLASASCLLPVCALAQPAAAQAVRGTSSLTIGSIGAGCIFGGALLGMALGKIVPAHHLSEDSKDAIKLGAGMISLMAALVLGLLVSSAKSNFDAANAAVTQGGARAILLDRVLAHYGAEAEEVREDLREAVVTAIETLWPEDHPMASGLGAFERTNAMERMLDKIRSLKPQTDAQRALHAQAQELANEILLSRWLEIEAAQTPLPTVFLVILLFWLTMLYVSFGLIAPRNGTVITVLLIGALSLATAVSLTLEMSDPMAGFIKVSSAPLQKVLEHLLP